MIRYGSHIHLPKDQRSVIIIQWYCTLADIADKIRQTTKLLKVDFSNYATLKNIGGPDDDLVTNINLSSSFYNDLTRNLKTISIDSNTIKETCCIYEIQTAS